MEQGQKFEYMQSIEEYLDSNQVYEVFEDLLKQVVVHRPANPIEFMLKRVKQVQGKWIIKNSYSVCVI